MEEHHTEHKLAIRMKKYKYIFTPDEEKAKCSYCDKVHGGMEELYDIENDPDELNNIVLKNPTECKELNSLLIKFRAKLKPKREKNIMSRLMHKFLNPLNFRHRE